MSLLFVTPIADMRAARVTAPVPCLWKKNELRVLNHHKQRFHSIHIVIKYCVFITIYTQETLSIRDSKILKVEETSRQMLSYELNEPRKTE